MLDAIRSLSETTYWKCVFIFMIAITTTFLYSKIKESPVLIIKLIEQDKWIILIGVQGVLLLIYAKILHHRCNYVLQDKLEETIETLKKLFRYVIKALHSWAVHFWKLAGHRTMSTCVARIRANRILAMKFTLYRGHAEMSSVYRGG